MTELPPIIERLDHALEMWHKRLQSGDDMQAFWEVSIAQMAPELRADLLRLQAERDHMEMTVRRYADKVGRARDVCRKELEATPTPALQRLYDTLGSADVNRTLHERDALLEALRGIIETGGDGVASMETAIQDARAAIANVEGKYD